MNKRALLDALGWGFLLWLIGYGLGIALFTIVPLDLIGWIITPIGTVITLFVLFKKIKSDSVVYYFLIGASWTLVAVVCDYFFLVQVFKPMDGYYKFDVYLYYLLTLTLPPVVGLIKTHGKK